MVRSDVFSSKVLCTGGLYNFNLQVCCFIVTPGLIFKRKNVLLQTRLSCTVEHVISLAQVSELYLRVENFLSEDNTSLTIVPRHLSCAVVT